MSTFFAIFGIVMGLWLNRLIIMPVQRKKAREECIREGLVPKDMT